MSVMVMRWVNVCVVLAMCAFAQEERPRARDLGIAPGVMSPGPLNAITDVAGVKVGHRTVVRGDSVRTGATAILPHDGNLFQEKVRTATFVFNAFGKLIGSTQIEELGVIETPIMLTNTLAVWEAADALKHYTLHLPGNEDVRSINPVVGETNDGRLNDIRGEHLRREDFLAAIQEAKSGPVEEGSVGAGTGTRAFGFKGGIGSSSRLLSERQGGYTVGVLVQSNFGGLLTVDGVPVGKELAAERSHARAEPEEDLDLADGSIMMIVATDAPADARQLKRIARRASFGLARTGSSGGHGSGDFVIAFSTERDPSKYLEDGRLGPLFQATIEATEEAILNSMLRATTVEGHRGNRAEAIPIGRLREILAKHGR
ncbi:MAG: P1 family peptidase [Bryobacterales bacterium]|nr:P1 family peptidase [Bryobacterales bacterium]